MADFFETLETIVGPPPYDPIVTDESATASPFDDYLANRWDPNRIGDPSARLQAQREVWSFALVDELSRPAMRELFGKDYALSDLLRIQYEIERFGLAQIKTQRTRESPRLAVTRTELVDMIELGVFFARYFMRWVSAADRLEHFLDAGASTSPDVTVPSTLLAGDEYVEGTVLDKSYDLLEDNLQRRVADGDAAAVWNPPVRLFGTTDETRAEPVVQRTGDTVREVFYFGSTVNLERLGRDAYLAYGTIHVYSKVTTERVLRSDGTWHVSIESWDVWGFDRYDWGDLQSVSIPIRLRENLRRILNRPGTPYENAGDFVVSWLERFLVYHGVPVGLLDHLVISDAVLNSLDGQTIDMPDGRTLQPARYDLFFEPWTLDLAPHEDFYPARFTIGP